MIAVVVGFPAAGALFAAFVVASLVVALRPSRDERADLR